MRASVWHSKPSGAGTKHHCASEQPVAANFSSPPTAPRKLQKKNTPASAWAGCPDGRRATGHIDQMSRDPSRRPPTPYAPLLQDIAAFRADSPCPFPLPAFVACLRTARRGAAAGPSGATNEHLRILLDDEGDTQLLHCAACRLAHADLPPPVLAALRIGRMTALQKPNSRGIRALVVGDVLRRLVGRRWLRVLRAATELDPRATVLSVDAVGAFDYVSREAMLSALLRHPDLRPLVPFARQFYSTPSSYTWTDDSGCSHVIAQGEGGEQGDPLMPALYALAQQPALCEVQAQLRNGKAIFAFLDDTYVVANPDRVRTLYDAFRAALWRHARVELNRGKTRVWNTAGKEPPGIADVQGDSDAVVWTGDWSLRPDKQGLLVLGTPLGNDAFVQRQLELKRAEHDKLLTRIPAVEDLQAAWCLSALLGFADAELPEASARSARLPLQCGGREQNSRLRVGCGLWRTVAREWGDECRINGELSSVPKGQAIAHDLNPHGVADRNINVHVSETNIARDSSAGLAGEGVLEW
ncbi:hypothetical protein AK812_SmicGene36427 [Symbiodinium microadriaticum]|uniref:Reverse transcriptase domain-containing protein n=1 Tax=Symbiodinium microadriaticum TaxID=2951 RepID=A0A1Q9CIX7_SYMMI|nr:hypothetical protein AK812_SmicGene36427 [Symbiodinium microadriaticum]